MAPAGKIQDGYDIDIWFGCALVTVVCQSDRRMGSACIRLASLFALLSLPDVPHDMYSARGIDSLNPLRQPERIFWSQQTKHIQTVLNATGPL